MSESADTITAELTAGTDYTLEFSRNFTEPLGARLPAFEVLDPDGEILSLDVFTHSLYPRELPAIICYTFTPETSGSYSFRVSNGDPNLSADVETDSVLFVYREMHNEAGENGYPTRFKLTDDTETVSVRDIIQLRKTIIEANPDYLDYLSGKTTANLDMNDDTKEFDSWLNLMKSSKGIDESGRVMGEVTASGKKIPDIVNELPYDSRYSPGTGIISTSNLSTFDSAIKSETLQIPTPTGKRGSSLFQYRFISSVEEYERNISGKTEISGSYGIVNASTSASYTNNFKFGQTSITFLIHYEELESSYREINTDKCTLKDDAAAILNQGTDKFRSNYGDYFVAGYQYGGVYNAFITITTETTEQESDIEATLKVAAKGDTANIDTNFAFSLKNAATRNNASVTVEVRTAGANDNLPDVQVLTGASAIDTVVSQLSRNNLARAFTPDSYTPVKVRLKRYYTLNGVRNKLSETIPITPAHWDNIAKLNTTIIAIRGLQNFIQSIPSDHILPNALDSYTSRFNNILGRITSTGDSFYENANLLNTTLNEATTLKNDLQALGERYVFYRKLVAAQKSEPRGNFSHNKYTYIGYESYPTSDIVQGDMNAGRSDWEERKYKLGQNRTWSPSYTAVQKNGSGDAVFYFLRIWCYGYEDQRHINNSPAIGTKNISFTFQRSAVREGGWTILRKTMRFNKTLYPFKGLERQ